MYIRSSMSNMLIRIPLNLFRQGALRPSGMVGSLPLISVGEVPRGERGGKGERRQRRVLRRKEKGGVDRRDQGGEVGGERGEREERGEGGGERGEA